MSVFNNTKQFGLDSHVEFIRSAASVFGLPDIFESSINALYQASIKPKPSWFPYDDSSTTVANTVYLAKPFLDWSLSTRCQNLLHEATHLLQGKRLTYPLMAVYYSLGAKRLELETEAFENNIRWLTVSGSIRKEKDPNRYVFSPQVTNTATNILSNYRLKSVDRVALIRRLARVVETTYALKGGA